MEIRDLIPKHKHDQKAIEKLKALSFDELEPIVPELLEWLQDMNWPIVDILEPFADQMIPQIIKILRTGDGMWKRLILYNYGLLGFRK